MNIEDELRSRVIKQLTDLIEKFKKISDDIVSLNSSVAILRWVLD